MATAEMVRDATNGFLRQFFEHKVTESTALDASYGRLWRATGKLTLAGGKRLRPYLTVLAYRAFGGSDDAAVLPVAAAQELLHSCLLIHDDIIDRDYLRYGTANVAGQYREIYAAAGLAQSEADHYSASAALLAGDLLLSSAYEVVNESTLPAADKLAVQRSLQRSMFLVAGGELLDSESTFTPQSITTTRTIARLKTASYSFEGPLTCGAALAGASGRQLEALQAAGTDLGIAYQMYDDLLGVFGGERTGKPTTSDLAEGKRTLLLQQTLAAADETTRQRITRLVGHGSISPADADYIRRAMADSGARAFVEAYAESHARQAQERLRGLQLTQPYEAYFEQLIGYMAERES